MERDILKSMLCDKLEKAVSHKKEIERSISMNGHTRYRKVKRIIQSHPISS